MPKFSVIVPVYNVEKYIEKCLDSLVNQTLEDIEIIVVNDGSPDNSQKIIDKYVKKYPNKVKSYIKENGGLGSARNYGISKATGEYIAFVDSDDYVEPEMFNKIYEQIKDSDTDLVIFENYIVNESYEITGNDIVREMPDCDNNFKYILNNNICVWNKLYKRELLVNNKFEFRSKIWYEDVDFIIKVMSKCKKIIIINEPFYNYLIRKGSIMNNSNITKNLDLILSFDEAINFLKGKKLYNKYKNEVEFLCIYHMYICGITRIINANSKMKNKIDIITKFVNYLETNFPDFKNNVYLKELSLNKKIIFKLLNLKMYNIIKLIFKLKKM